MFSPISLFVCFSLLISFLSNLKDIYNKKLLQGKINFMIIISVETDPTLLYQGGIGEWQSPE